MATDSGIVIIYDMENEGAPLTCHRIDAKEFLTFPRWAASPDGKKEAIGDAKSQDTGDDTGQAMALKAESFKALQAMAKKAMVSGWEKMKKAELVAALLTD